MQDTINRLARGIFEYEPPVIELSELNIDEAIGMNSIYSGELHIRSKGDKKIKGIVSSSNHAVKVDTPQFVGVENVIKYHVDSRGIRKGERIEGRFNVISNGGEIAATYSFRIADHTVESSMGAIKNMFHFTNLVQTEPEEAYRLFVSDNFPEIFLKDDYELRNRYELLLYGDKPKYLGPQVNVKQCVEEFLVSIHKKNRVVLGISDSEREYDELTASITDQIVITKNTWGAVNVEITCDNDCVIPKVSSLDEERFAGGKYELSYVVDYEKLHGGNNYAMITIRTATQELSLRIVARKASSLRKANAKTFELQQNLSFVMESYLAFRVKKINLSQWTKQSLSAIEKVRSVDDTNPFYMLLHAQLLISVRKREEALWLLNQVKELTYGKEEEYPALTAYYLYVNSLYRQESDYAVESLRKCKRLFDLGQDDWRILWVIFYLDEEYERNKSLKIARIKEQFYKGCHSPIMYLEAALAFDAQPPLLRVFDDFEIQTVLFACKMGLLSDRLIDHIVEIADNKKSYSACYLKLLKILYERTKNPEFLSVIYKMMVKEDSMPKDAFVWIKRAVEADLKITNLYENYMTYCDKSDMSPLPKILLMYFAYNSSLEYNLKAYLFANVYYNRYDDPETFELYRYQMERFILDMLSKGRINQHLARLYKEMLEPSMINQDTSRMLANILFSYRVTCTNKDMTTLYVKHKETGEVFTRPMVNGEGYVSIYTESAGIAVGDAAGNRYSGEELYTVTKAFDGDKYIPLAFKYLPNDLWLCLYFGENGLKYGYTDKEMMEVYRTIIDDSRVTERCRQEMMGHIIDYFHEEYNGDDFDHDYIFPDMEKLDEENRIKVTETYILNGKYDLAMQIIRARGAVGVNPKRLLRMCDSLIRGVEGEEDPEVLGICEMVLKQHKYDEEVLEYLVKYYECATRDMIDLWKVAMDFGVDTTPIEERLLYQMLFIHSHNSNISKVFESYYEHGARERLVQAYIAYNAYNYFVKQEVISVDVFRVIEHDCLEKKEVLDVCKMALLHYYADDIDTIELSEEQKELAQDLLHEMADKKKIFSFYRKLQKAVHVPHEVMDKSLVEYRTNPDSKVFIHYINEKEDGKNEYVVEAMENVYEGIFVKNFMLFYGDNMQYYITENHGEEEELTESGNVTNQELTEEMQQGRFGMLNDMLSCIELSDQATLKKLMNSYVMSDIMSKELFHPLGM